MKVSERENRTKKEKKKGERAQTEGLRVVQAHTENQERDRQTEREKKNNKKKQQPCTLL